VKVVAVSGTRLRGRRHGRRFARSASMRSFAVTSTGQAANRSGGRVGEDGPPVRRSDRVEISTPCSSASNLVHRGVHRDDAVLAGVPCCCARRSHWQSTQTKRGKCVRSRRAGRARWRVLSVRFHEQLINSASKLPCGKDRSSGGLRGPPQGETSMHYATDEGYRTSYAQRGGIGGGVMLTQVPWSTWCRTGRTVRAAFASAATVARSSLDVDVDDRRVHHRGRVVVASARAHRLQSGRPTCAQG